MGERLNLDRTQSCRSCGARIVYAPHERTGSQAPIDAEPVENGIITINENGTYHVMSKAERDPGSFLRIAGPYYTNHFITCPNAEQHHKTKRS